MKKLLVLFIAAMCCLTEGICKGAPKDETRDIYIQIVKIGGGLNPRPRSSQPFIEAEIDAMAGQLVMYFNYELGKVSINIKNSMGQVVSHYSCDTDTEPMVLMNVSSSADDYTIDISGTNVEAYGHYVIPAN